MVVSDTPDQRFHFESRGCTIIPPRLPQISKGVRDNVSVAEETGYRPSIQGAWINYMARRRRR